MTPTTTPRDGGGLRDLLVHGLRGMVYAEARVNKALPALIAAARDPRLREGLALHRAQTAQQIEALQQLFDDLGVHASSESCDAMEGILEEAETLLERFAGKPACDAAIVFAAKAIEQYEVCRYRGLLDFARRLGLNDALPVLERILAQEEAAGAALEGVAGDGVNAAAMAA